MSQKIGTVKKLESSPLDSNKTDSVKGDENLSYITTLYEKNIGLVYNAHLADELKEYASYPREWLERAFKEAADANARNWRYVRKCLDNWKSAGKIAFKKEDPKPRNTIPTFDANGRIIANV
jgi:DnaD/phage-associated family protein